MASKLPQLSGNELIRLYKENGWVADGRRTHGLALVKELHGERIVVIIPTKNRPLKDRTLNGIIGPKQSRVGRAGLLAMLENRVKRKKPQE